MQRESEQRRDYGDAMLEICISIVDHDDLTIVLDAQGQRDACPHLHHSCRSHSRGALRWKLPPDGGFPCWPLLLHRLACTPRMDHAGVFRALLLGHYHLLD